MSQSEKHSKWTCPSIFEPAPVRIIIHTHELPNLLLVTLSRRVRTWSDATVDGKGVKGRGARGTLLPVVGSTPLGIASWLRRSVSTCESLLCLVWLALRVAGGVDSGVSPGVTRRSCGVAAPVLPLSDLHIFSELLVRCVCSWREMEWEMRRE